MSSFIVILSAYTNVYFEITFNHFSNELHPKPGHLFWGADYVLLLSISFEIIKLVTEQDYGIREVAKLHKISHALVIYWLKAFSGKRAWWRKIALYEPSNTENSEAKDEKERHWNSGTTDFSPKAFRKLQRELALARAKIAYLKELEALDRQKTATEKRKIIERLKPAHA